MTDAGATRAVFLDRDGVINEVVLREGKPHPPASVEALEILPGVAEAIASLREAGLRVVVVTNQPDVRTGVQRREVVEAMHERLGRELLIDDFRVCFHVDADGCACRKPAPGMLLEAAEALRVDLSRSFLVGDRWRDVGAGRAAGCRTFFIDRGYREAAAEDPDFVVSSLPEAAAIILTELAGAGPPPPERTVGEPAPRAAR